MNITFLVGNGFDINLGLKTLYTDFYPYYLSKNHKDIISDAIADNYKRWSDLELALGEILTNVDPKQVSDFLDCKAVLESDLADYLRKEQEKIDVTSSILQAEFQANVSKFYKEFPAKEKKYFSEWLYQVKETIHYQFISFNYTNTLDGIVELAKQNKPFSTHSSPGLGHNDLVGDILHLHGTLSGDMILGLDNIKQIGNPELQISTELTNYIIKAAINEALGEERITNAQQIINNSDYVCVYGMSLGETDLMWWQFLVDWLSKKNARRLVLFAYEKANTPPSGSEKLRLQDKWKNKFLKTADINPENLSKIRSQIIVIIRSKIFNFSDIKFVTEETEPELTTV